MRETLLIEDHTHLAPANIPADIERRKGWADYACVEWPTELMAQCYRGWESQKYRDDSADYQKFSAMYEAWFALSETEKDRAMHPIQRNSPRRYVYRAMARQIAVGILPVKPVRRMRSNAKVSHFSGHQTL